MIRTIVAFGLVEAEVVADLEKSFLNQFIFREHTKKLIAA